MKLKQLLVLSLGLTLGWASADEETRTGSFWTEGVSVEGGWYDAEKNQIDGDMDDNMCYAASAANLIAWWQNGKVGSTLTSEAPKKLEDIWQTFIDSNQIQEEGGEALAVINWWVSGVYMPTTDEEWSRYYISREDYGTETLPLTLPNGAIEGYYYSLYGLDQQRLSDFLHDMQMYDVGITKIDFADFLSDGCGVSLGIETDAGESEDDEGSGHSITLWAVEYDENGKLIKIWVTDSDDEAKQIVEVPVEVDEANDKIWMKNDFYGSVGYFISSVYVVGARESFKWSEVSMRTYVNLQVNPSTHNGYAGASLLPEVYMSEAPAEEGALESVLEAVDSGEMNDRSVAAVAGASTVALGLAFAGDMDRQLSAIRNRAAMGSCCPDSVALDGKNGSTEQPDKFFAWVNAEGNRAEQKSDRSAAGYTLSSWGGTVGAGMMVNHKLTMGLGVTAMYGDVKSDGPDILDGDMDTKYLSVFARFRYGSWSHSFVGAVGTMDVDYRRSVVDYANNGDTDGSSFGFMYELNRELALNDWSHISPLFNISYRHTAVDAYRECGTDAALNVGKQNLNTVTGSLGARYAAEVGRQMLNRACAVEARALAKYDFGDNCADASVGFVDYATRANIESAERGAMGLELGAGIAVPVGSGSIFADGAVELRNDYVNLNAALGYKIQF